MATPAPKPTMESTARRVAVATEDLKVAQTRAQRVAQQVRNYALM